MMSRILKKTSLVIAIIAMAIITYPARQALAGSNIDIIVPLGSGGALDRFARTAERFLPNVIDADVTVKNFSPKRGEDGYRAFMEGPKDGSTILAWFEPAAAVYGSGMSIDDLAIINVQEIEPPILAARRDLGWKNLDDMIKAIRKEPSRFRFSLGSPNGGGPLLTSALLEKLDLEIRPAIYPSGGKARKAIIDGSADFTAGSLSAIRKLGEEVTPLAVFAPRRLRAWPDVPTISEALGTNSKHAVHGAVYRFFAVHKSFAEDEPEAFADLVEAFRRMVEEDEGFRSNSLERGAGALWLGPEDSTSLIQRSHQYFNRLISARP